MNSGDLIFVLNGKFKNKVGYLLRKNKEFSFIVFIKGKIINFNISNLSIY